MPSSISSSELNPVSKALRPRVAIALLLVIACALYGVAELAADIGLSRFSQIHRRIIQEQRATEAVRPALPAQPATVLLLGNSLLLEDVDFPQLEERVSSRFRLSRFVVEQTNYFDWEFGLRRILRHGSRPDYIVVCLTPGQFRSSAIRGDFDARFLFDMEDIWPLSRSIGADLTTTTGFYFAHVSTFYGARAELRNVLLGKMGFQAIALLMHDLVTVPLVEPEQDMTPIYAARLKALQQLCAAKGVKFAFLIPPTMQAGDKEMVLAGEANGVTVLRPIANYSLGPEQYRDGFHLNAAGAKIFTAAVGDALLSHF